MNQTIHCIIDKKTFYDVNIRNILRSRLVSISVFAIVIIILSLINPGLFGSFYYTVAGMVLLMFAILFFTYRSAIRKAYEQTKKFNALEYDLVVDDDGIEMQTAQSQSKYSYNQFVALKDYKTSLCLFPSKDRVIIIPKDQCPAELADFLRQRIGV